MKHKLQTMLKHNWRTLLLLLTLITTSQGMWGENVTVYVYGKNANAQAVNTWENPEKSFTIVKGAQTFSFTLNSNDNALYTKQGDHYIGISESSTKYYKHPALQYCLDISDGNIIYPSEDFNSVTKIQDNYTGSNCGLYILKYVLKNDVDQITFEFTGDKTKNLNTCNNCDDSNTPYGNCTNCSPRNFYRVVITTSSGGTSSAPVVRMGYMPQNEDNNDVTVSGYVASRGCNNGSTGSITGFTIYYSKTSFSTGSESGVYTKSISAPSGITPSESPARNSVYSMVIPAEDLADNGWRNGDPLYVRIKATNDADLTSDISDIQNITYTLCANMINEVYLLPAEGAVVTGSTLSLLPSVDNTEAVGVVYTWEKNDEEWGTGDSKSVTANANVKIKVTASESTCNSSASVTHNYTVCTPAITNLTISGCPAGDVGKGSSVTLTASTETGTPDSWAWYLDGVSTGDTDNSYTFTPSAAVDYTAKVVAEGCPDRKLDAVCVISAKSTFTVPSPAMAPTFNACKDHHQFIWSGESGMFNPAPERYDVCVGSEPGGATDAYGEFEMLGSKYMVWKPGNKAAGTYTYCFTAHRTGYISKSTTLTITYQKTASAQGINSITIDGTAYAGEPYPEVMPWTPAALATSIPAGSSEITSIKWTVSPTGPQISPTNSNATTAEFKGRAVDEKTLYTITATGLTSTCGEGGSSTTKIYVKPEAAERCD